MHSLTLRFIHSILISFVIVGLTGAKAHSAASCQELFFSRSYTLIEIPNSIKPRDGGAYISYVAKDYQGKIIGEFEAKVNEKTVSNSYYEIPKARHRRQGLSKDFMDIILKRFPDVNTIKVELSQQNFTALGNISNLVKSDPFFIEAVKQTPSFKLYSKYGFNKIEITEVDVQVVDVTFTREVY